MPTRRPSGARADEVRADAPRAGPAAGLLCTRIRDWLRPVWGLRLPPADFAHNDLNLSNILTDGERITGVIDWDEFGLGSRALDLIVLALDCQQPAGCSRRPHPPSVTPGCAAWSATAPWPYSPRTSGRTSRRRPTLLRSPPSLTDCRRRKANPRRYSAVIPIASLTARPRSRMALR
ncbi:MAG TPA: phosphotransferase [Trebonia sp.]|nr:phosphotransferase [Trebonia sp.]